MDKLTPRGLRARRSLVYVFFLGVGIVLGAFGGYLAFTPKAQPLPTIQQAPPPTLQLGQPGSGEQWREITYQPDGKTLARRRIAHDDGGLVDFRYDSKGALTNVSVYALASDAQPAYSADYDTRTGKMIRTETHRADGSLDTIVSYFGDGSQQALSYRADGSLSGNSVTTSDGAGKTTTYGADGKTITAVTMTGAQDTTVTLGNWHADDSTATPAPKLKIKMRGGKALSWDYLDAYGNVEHHGEYLADGSILFTYFNSNGSVNYRQLWKRTGTDNLRSYYELARTDDYGYYGNLNRQLFFWEDGKTVKEARHFNSDGTPESIRYYDRKGNMFRRDNFDFSGHYTGSEPAPTWYTSTEWVYDNLKAEPGVTYYNSQRIYRLRGTPFSQPALDGPSGVDPVFIQ